MVRGGLFLLAVIVLGVAFFIDKQRPGYSITAGGLTLLALGELAGSFPLP